MNRKMSLGRTNTAPHLGLRVSATRRTRLVSRALAALAVCALIGTPLDWAPAGDHTQLARAQGGGEEHVVTITARNAVGLAAFDATLLYDPAIVSFVQIRPGDFLPDGSAMLGPEVDGAGRVSFGAFSPSGATVDGGGTLAEAIFTVTGDGEPDLRFDMAGSGLYDAVGAPLGSPARLSAAGVSLEAIYMPYAGLRH